MLAAAVVEEADRPRLREAMRAMLLGRQPWLHWRDEAPSRRRLVAKVVAELGCLHLVVVGAPMRQHSQERSRHKCLERLLVEVDAIGVDLVMLESRQSRLNAADLAVVEAFRGQRLIRRDLRVEHGYPTGEHANPELWVSDAVAGAVRAAYGLGTDEYLTILKPCLDLIEITLE